MRLVQVVGDRQTHLTAETLRTPRESKALTTGYTGVHGESLCFDWFYLLRRFVGVFLLGDFFFAFLYGALASTRL